MDREREFQQRYRAVAARDARFDGQFCFAVTTTGIYCRPSCPARTPKPENITFFSTSAGAHEAGFRACRRCLPEAAPGTPEWNLRQDLAARAMRLIREGIMNGGGVAELSSALGYSSRQVHRALTAELGAGPLTLARAHRAQTARTLLVSTDLPLSDVAFASGFSSVRQFHHTCRQIFDSTPAEIRARRRRRLPGSSRTQAAAEAAPLTVEIELPVRAPFDAAGVFGFLAERALPGVEAAEISPKRLRYARTLRLPGGPGALELTSAAGGVQVRCEVSTLSDVPAAVAAARRLLDLDADPAAVDSALSEDPALRPLVERTPGIRLPGTADAHEYLIRAIVGQQISVAAARTQLSRLVARTGTGYVSGFAGLDTLFPSSEQILAAVEDPGEGPLDPHRPLRLPARSLRTVRAAAQALLSGEMQLHSGAEPAQMRRQLTAVAGIGEWTASYLQLRVLGHPDTWMRGDVALIAGAQHLGLLGPAAARTAAQSGGGPQRAAHHCSAQHRNAQHRQLAEHAQRWAPWRSYAAMHLWAAASPSKGHTDEH
ncbi:AlkA N-terminal domain-containing protein [Nesterenkonia sp.]|uniref:DNA-3-methyladenine glycosylase 2 family protein n=1 Tax=Nesterenkonia sp. TaxID=704201 RepID=UPI002626C219|nr:AlkA N-terminal domain-containing protein [Nesterenkonia sp.]